MQRRGFVLLVTMVVLVLLTIVGTQVTLKVSGQRQRMRYLIDYSRARYACDSALKFALNQMETIEFSLVSRPNEPDFSNLFALTEEEYQLIMEEWQAERAEQALWDSEDVLEPMDGNDPNDDPNALSPMEDVSMALEDPCAADLTVRGPYGPAWPNIIPPMEFEIGEAKVTIEIEDENAKYPLTWMLLDDEQNDQAIEASFETFLSYMNYSVTDEVASMMGQLEELSELKRFQLEFKPVAVGTTPNRGTPPSRREAKPRRPNEKGKKPPSSRISPKSGRTTGGKTKKISPEQQEQRQQVDFARLMNSPLLDHEFLGRPSIESDTREESALKYIGLWATKKVNINTAPQHVLEAAFGFAGQTAAIRIRDAVIAHRRSEPIQDIADLKKVAGTYATAIENSQDFITMTSDTFTIRVTVVQGMATVRSVVAVTRNPADGKVRTIAVISS